MSKLAFTFNLCRYTVGGKAGGGSGVSALADEYAPLLAALLPQVGGLYMLKNAVYQQRLKAPVFNP